MKQYKLKDGHLSITCSECFSDAGAAELRVLLALIEGEFEYGSEDELARAARTTRSRVISALALFESEGIITEDNGEPEITLEFEARRDEKPDRSSLELAKTVRDDELRELFEECAALMNQAALPHEEAKKIATLRTDEGLEGEFIATLAAYIAKGGKLTVARLVREAERLKKKGIETLEALDAYLKEKENEHAYEYEFRGLLGIWGRTLSPSEKEYAKKWFDEYGYSSGILGMAYDITVKAKGTLVLPYMAKIVDSWHEAGYSTVEECKTRIESDKIKQNAEREQKKQPPSRRKPAAPQRRLGSFDISKVLERALEKSYGALSEDEEKKNGD